MADRSKRNELFLAAVRARGYNLKTFSAEIGVNYKTVQRWYYDGRIPRLKYRAAVKARLQMPIEQLWPALAQQKSDSVLSRKMALSVEALGEKFVAALIGSTVRELTICSDDLWFLRMVAKAYRLPAKTSPFEVRVVVSAFIPAAELQALGFYNARFVRRHQGVGPAAIVRADGVMLIVPHILGLPCADAPVIVIRQKYEQDVFDKYVKALDKLWETGLPPAGRSG